MKCTDTYQLGLAVQALTAAELTRAVKAHGGRYDFPNPYEADSFVPILVANLDEGPAEVIVKSVVLDEAGLHVIGNETKDTFASDPVDYPADVFLPGQLGNITALIPATPDTDDVTLSAKGDLSVDPEILFNLATETCVPFIQSGMPYSRYYELILKKAAELTSAHAQTDWNETDFWLEMEKEADLVIRKQLHAPLLRMVTEETGSGSDAVAAYKAILERPRKEMELPATTGLTDERVSTALAVLEEKHFIRRGWGKNRTSSALYSRLDKSW